MEVPLTPLEFARRAARLVRRSRGGRRRCAAPHLRAVLRAVRPVVGGAAAGSASSRATGSPISRRTRTRSSSRSTRCRRSARSWCRSTIRLSPDEFAYIINALGRDGRVRPRGLPRGRSTASVARLARAFEHFVALEGERDGLARLRGARSAGAGAEFDAADDRRDRSADDQLHQRHDVAAEGRDDHAPQRLHERRRHAAAPPDAADGPLSVDAADVPRQRLDVRLDR